MSTSTPAIAFVADEQYVMPMAAAIASVIANLGAGRAVHIYVVDAGVLPASRAKLRRLNGHERMRLEWLHPTLSHRDTMASLPSGYVAQSAYYKLLLPELLGAHDRIIYLDCDVIVEADIAELWTADVGDNYVLAAQDVLNPLVSSPFGLRNWRELGRKPTDELFNSGVLVLNAAKWREDQIALKLLEYLRNSWQHVRLCDQDAMNAVFCGQWGRLDRRWNVLQYMKLARRYCLLDRRQHDRLLAEAYAIHFCGPQKPWHRHSPAPPGARFFHYLDLTPWAGWRPSRWTLGGHAFTYYVKRAMIALRRMHPRSLHPRFGNSTTPRLHR